MTRTPTTLSLTDATTLAKATPIRFPNESQEYRAARTKLLAEEIELRRHLEHVAAQRRALPPGGEVTKNYRFEGDEGETDFAGLFEDHDTLVLYSFMFGPERTSPCPMCTNLLGPLSQNAADLRQRVALGVIQRGPLARAQAFAVQRGWRNLPIWRDITGDYSRDYFGLLPDGTEVPALNVFTKIDGTIRHFWGGELTGNTADPDQDPRGAPDLAPLWNILDLTPKGRGTDWYPKLDYPG